VRVSLWPTLTIFPHRLFLHLNHVPHLRLDQLLKRTVPRPAAGLRMPIVHQPLPLQIQPQPVQPKNAGRNGQQDDNHDNSVHAG